MKSQLLRNSLKLATAIFLTAALAVHYQRIQFVYYPLMAALVVVDDNDEQTWKSAGGRIFGTVVGGLVTFLVHTIAAGWVGVLLSLLIMIPILRLFGWSSGLGTASTLCVMFLMLPSYSALNWDYVFNRTLDTAVGCAVGLITGLLFWPRNRRNELKQIDSKLHQHLCAQVEAYQAWTIGAQPLPKPLPPAAMSQWLIRMQQLVTLEQNGPKAHHLERSHWPQRLMLWRLVGFHWVQWERLLETLVTTPGEANSLPGQGPIDPANPLERSINNLAALLLNNSSTDVQPVAAMEWQTLAHQSGRPLLLLLALAEEQRPMLASLRSLSQIARRMQ